MKKKIISFILIGTFLVSTTPIKALADDVFILRESKQNYASEGDENYKPEVSEEQLKARQEAREAYSSEIADKSINIIPMFDDWTTREALAKVNNIGTKILLANDIDDFVRFSVSRKEVVNAYASYHGEVSVYRGLLNYVETEDELAYVLGHELAHIYKKDPRTGMIRRGVAIGAILVGAALAGAYNGGTGAAGDGMVLAGAGGLAADPALTKRQEARADINGIDFMVKAGYNPLGAISFMNKILDRNWDLFRDHPNGNKRMMAAYFHIEKQYPKYLDGGYDTISYQRAMAVINKRKEQIKVKKQNKQNSKNDKKTITENKDEEI